MRTLVHLSDLHFGRVDLALLDPLVASVTAAAPDLVVVSGDLTQRAKRKQFAAAAEFLERLPRPQIVVPGNHDVPLWNVFNRFLRPLANYRRHITRDLQPRYRDDEIAVLGINTARSLVIKNGRINHAQIDIVRDEFCALPESVTKIIVTHHPFDLPQQFERDDLVGRAGLAMRTFARCGADLLLAGHMHAGHAGNTAARYGIVDHAAVVVQAGTATSTRGRGEANSYNVVRVESHAIAVARCDWDARQARFVERAPARFTHAAGVWRRA
jgi:3',5'-cyclic AMP phosphodiesterase CpdA